MSSTDADLICQERGYTQVAVTSIYYGITSPLAHENRILPMGDVMQRVRRELKAHHVPKHTISWLTHNWLKTALSQIGHGNADALEIFNSNQCRHSFIGVYRPAESWTSGAVWCALIDLRGKVQISAPYCRNGLSGRAQCAWDAANEQAEGAA